MTFSRDDFLSVRTLILCLLALVVIRLLLAYGLPVVDTTEARYAEIARKMWALQDWITPWHGDGDPFWGKPPLAFWLSALSMGVFGVNEWAARLPAFLASLGTVGLVMQFAYVQYGDLRRALVSGLMLFSSLLFFVFSATVMLDAALVFCITLSQVSFWFAMTERGKQYGYLFFVGLGLGLLAKGPLAVVLVGIPIFFWVLLRNQWLLLWQRLPWISGTVLTALIAVPWYVLAELKTPGFLQYFIIGEHFGRFLDPGWQGDRYGWAHETLRGAIWGYFLVSMLPWCGLWLYWRKTGRVLRGAVKAKPAQLSDDSTLYVLLWMLATLLFFSLSRNTIMPYAMPALPAGALLLSETLWLLSVPARKRWVLGATGFVGAIGIALFVASQMPSVLGTLNTYKTVIEWVPEAEQDQLYIWEKRNFSAEFYSQNRVQYLHSPSEVAVLAEQEAPTYIVLRRKEWQEAGIDPQQWHVWRSLQINNKPYDILTNQTDSL